jgi:phosphate/sulfate permease
MKVFTFWIYTGIAGSVFAYALLWTIAQWLKADREVEEVEKEMVARRVQERSAKEVSRDMPVPLSGMSDQASQHVRPS